VRIVYLRTDFWFDVVSGGSVGHIKGVITGLRRLGHDVRVFSTDRLYGVGSEIAEVTVVRPWWPLRLPKLKAAGAVLYNRQLYRAVRPALDAARPDFIYQRHSVYNATGARLSRATGIPLVLEVNGIEVLWSREHGFRRALEGTADRLEREQFAAAALILTVSEVVRDQLLAYGVAPDRIVVNPNAVDPEVFRPDIDAKDLRARLTPPDRTVIGWIGTFAPWHGVDVLAEAIPLVVAACPRAHFLLIGDGASRRDTERQLAAAGVGGAVTFAGTVPYADAPRYLAACDLYVSPHSPPRTGPFIGSPTKLFEYMAMGRGIVASDLGQIGQVLKHGETAVLVPPGDAPALADAVCALVAAPAEAHEMGGRARDAVCRWHTWTQHAARIVEAVNALA
jgi:glycosyltransferase involved in cell wall biosynthesis